MPRTPFAITALFLLSMLPAQRNGGQGGGQREPRIPELKNFTAESGTITSTKVRQGEAGYTIFLPKGYADEANKDTKYPWVLWLSGFGGSNEFIEKGGIGVLDRLRGEDKVPPMAFVIYRGPGRRTVYMNGEAADTEDLLTGDFLDQVQAKYRLTTDSKHRALMGISAGGFGAMKIALRHPELFAAVATHSAAILPADPEELEDGHAGMIQRLLRGGLAQELGDPIDKAKWAAHMPMGIVAAKKPEELKGLQIYFDAGTADSYELCPPNEELSKKMTAAGHKHLFRKVEGGGHAFGSDSMLDSVAVSLQFVAAALTGKDAVTVIGEAMAKQAAETKAAAPKEVPKEEPKKDAGK